MTTNEKPWDILRESAPMPPIGNGTWRTPNNAIITIKKCQTPGTNHIELSTCNDDGPCFFDSGSLRELAEFCIVLADQMEGKP